MGKDLSFGLTLYQNLKSSKKSKYNNTMVIGGEDYQMEWVSILKIMVNIR
jgi:hypothetical protein